MRLASLAVLTAALAAAAPALSQTSQPTAQTPAAAPTAPPAAPVARAEDVASPDAVVGALYTIISGEPGPRDWDRLRSLFLPGANMGVSARGADGQTRARLFTVDRYVESSGRLFLEKPFFERELGRRTLAEGALTQVLSGYEARTAAGAADGEVIQRGINAIQLIHDGSRWWIASIVWTVETPQTPLPADLAGTR